MPHVELADFLKVAADFQLGMLDTERPHPDTIDLSLLSKEDLPSAIESLKAVDAGALAVLKEKVQALEPLARSIRRTIDEGYRIFLCGCGATGRLSISLEIFARRGLLRGASGANVIGFMAGGDAALIRSIERFEDRPDYGERQLLELGFRNGDLLIASTEGGETPFVIGCTEMAARVSSRKPFFLYCNPDNKLRGNVERSRRIIDEPKVEKVNLAVGPMALTGSTRMQASTVLMAAIGFAMKHSDDPSEIETDFDRWRHTAIDKCDWSFLAEFIRAEAGLYESGGYVLYEPGEFGITVLTDTTERSPTFTLTPFERRGEDEPPSRSFLHVPGTGSSLEAWREILGREPRPLDWGELRRVTGREAVEKFDFSDPGTVSRMERLGGAEQRFFRLSRPGGSRVRWQFGSLDQAVEDFSGAVKT